MGITKEYDFFLAFFLLNSNLYVCQKHIKFEQSMEIFDGGFNIT